MTKKLVTPDVAIVEPTSVAETDTDQATPSKKQRKPRKPKTTAVTASTEPSTATVEVQVEPAAVQSTAQPEPTSPGTGKSETRLLVECQQSTLAIALGHIVEVVPLKPLQPVLANVKLEVEEEQLTLIATDSAQTLWAMVTQLTTTKVGQTTTLAETLNKVVSRSAVGILTLEETDRLPNNALTITDSDDGVTTLSRASTEQFPELLIPQTSYSLPARVVLTALKDTLIAASKEDTKGVIYGVNCLFDPSEQTFCCTATDGHRITRVEAEIASIGRKKRESVEPLPVLHYTLPLPVVRVLCKLLGSAGGDATLEFNYDAETHQAVFSVAVADDLTCVLVGRCHATQYPDVNRLIGNFTFDKHVITDRVALQTRLERLDAIVSLPIVDLHFTGTQLHLDKEGPTVQGQQSLEAVIPDAAQNFKISLNLKYLLDFVKAINTTQITLIMGSSVSLVKIKEFPTPAPTEGLETTIETTYYMLPMTKAEAEQGGS